MSIDSEKITDCQLLNKFNEVFGCFYNTVGNNKLFGSKIPDGWFEYNDNLFIIENKKDLKDKRDGLKQLLNYYLIASKTEEFKKYKQCFLILGGFTFINRSAHNKCKTSPKFDKSKLGCGTSKNFKYWIYSMDNNNIKETKYKLKDLKTKDYKPSFDLKEIHEFNQYLYNCGINLQKNQKTLFVAAILLCLKVNPRLIVFLNEKDKGFIIADYMLKIIKEEYKDLIFAKSFEFIKYNLHNKELFDLINIVSFDVKKYGIDILKQFYNEFMIYDKNNDSACGIVLTPHDIVELMVKSLNIKKGESVADFCTGTGSFLVEASKYTNNLIGCENGEERYALAKCNFILKDLSIEHLYFNNCFNQQFESYDHIILNPPFSCNSSDNGEIEDLYGWRKLKNEQKFVIYQLQYLKDGGIGCCIIPRNNFNNSTSKSNNFKKILLDNCQIIKIINCNSKVFAPAANVECTVCVFKKCKSEDNETEIIDYSDDGYIIKDKTRIKQKEANIKSYKTYLKFDNDWNYNEPLNISININQILIEDEKVKYFNEINKNISNCNKIIELTEEFKNKIKEINNLKVKEWKQIKIGDYFDFVKNYKTFQVQNSEDGEYPLITRSALNNGITKYINDYSLDGEYLTIAPSGSSGSTFYHNGKIAVDKMLKVLKLKKDKNLDLKLFALMANYYLTKKYNYNNGLTIEKIKNEIINYPLLI